LNRKGSGADPSRSANSSERVYAIFLGYGSGWHIVVKAYSLDGDACDGAIARTTVCHSEVERYIAISIFQVASARPRNLLRPNYRR
jgi:hypothetical protein